jgi:hypothetical protein
MFMRDTLRTNFAEVPNLREGRVTIFTTPVT